MCRRGRGMAVVCALVLAACAPTAAAAEPRTVDVQGAVPARAPVLVPSTIVRASGWSFSAVATADVDGDGRPDVLALDPRRRGVVVARAVGGGRFAVRRFAGLFRVDAGEQFAIGDLNRDGRPDLVTTGLRRGLAVQVAYGQRRGFSRGRFSRVVAGGAPVADVAVADVDGDRRPDVIVGLSHQESHRSRPGDGIVVMRGRADRRFAAPLRPTAVRGGLDRGGVPPQVLAGDLDGDSAVDLVFRGVVIRGLGRGRFAAPVALAPGPHGLDGESVARTLVARQGRLDVVGTHRVRPHNAVQRLGVVSHGTRASRPAVITRLQPRTLDDSVWIGVPGRRTAIAAGRLRDGPGFDVALAAGNAIWLTQTTDGTRLTAAVPTIIPGADRHVDRQIAIADLDGDRRADVVSADSAGRLLLLRNAGPLPPARPVLPLSAPLITADGAVYPVVSCTLGAGACIGSLNVLDRLLQLRLAPGATTTARISTGNASQPAAQTLLRWQSPLIGAETPLTLTEPNAAERTAACLPPPASGVLARGRDYVLIRDRDYLEGGPGRTVSICSTVTGGHLPLQGDEEDSEVIAPPIAAYDGFVATLRDVCPGGFEGCIAGLRVQRVPGLATVSEFVVGTGVDAVAVGAQGALAWIACPYAGEFDPTCDNGPYDIYRLDERGRRRVGGGRRIDPRSLQTTPGGLGFTWTDAGQTRTSRWTGRPPRTLPRTSGSSLKVPGR